ncbi:energy transducer TonB [Acidicapsa ligni]|uniref:energy transducer TonB n=1 Tax=Acidicapsa ligni TaxID=542300 RepID=UPI0021DF82D2|nr:energy transducer TonB [Acidicapsa ligni]
MAAEDMSGIANKAVGKSTLDQPGTHPFHLKATYAPSLERDKASNRTGEIEIWWQSPTKWRREVRSPEFHQIAIVDGQKEWQKNDGNYFPEWLRELSEAMIRPVPIPADALSKRIKTAEVHHVFTQTNIEWQAISTPLSTPPNEQIDGKGYLALSDKTGLLLYTGGPGFNGLYHDFKDFHGRMIAYTVAAGYVEVTAKISVLEDLAATPEDYFNATAPGGDGEPIQTVVLDESNLRKNLLPGKSFDWPALQDGPLEGVVWTEVVVDRTGTIREMIPPIADNPGVKEAAEQTFRSMQFSPILRDGIPVQAMGRLSLRFKTVRPSGIENFDSAHNYFERGRKVSCLGSGSSEPYLLRAEFQIATKSGIQTGRYEDTWISATKWKREAWFGSSHLVRTEEGDKYYVISEGPEINLLAW